MKKTLLNNRIVKILKFIFTLPDLAMFAYYSALPKAIKQVKLTTSYTRKRKNKTSFSDLNFNKIVKLVDKECTNYLETNSFLLAFLPTIILAVLIWF